MAYVSRSIRSYQRRFKVLPLDLLLAVINDEIPMNDGTPIPLSVKIEAARAAAPYLHPRAVEDEHPPQQNTIDLSKLTDEELLAFERIVIKAQRPLLPPIDVEAEEIDEEGETIN